MCGADPDRISRETTDNAWRNKIMCDKHSTKEGERKEWIRHNDSVRKIAS